jgi:hypothetical protein
MRLISVSISDFVLAVVALLCARVSSIDTIVVENTVLFFFKTQSQVYVAAANRYIPFLYFLIALNAIVGTIRFLTDASSKSTISRCHRFMTSLSTQVTVPALFLCLTHQPYVAFPTALAILGCNFFMLQYMDTNTLKDVMKNLPSGITLASIAILMYDSLVASWNPILAGGLALFLVAVGSSHNVNLFHYVLAASLYLIEVGRSHASLTLGLW